jgi:hypothetical protein
MSIYKDLITEEESTEKKVSSKPFKTVTVEYFEEFDSQDDRRIRVVTTICVFNSGSSKGEPTVSVSYEYL